MRTELGNLGCDQRAGGIGNVRLVVLMGRVWLEHRESGSWPQENHTAQRIGEWGCSLSDAEGQTQARMCKV